MARRRVSARRRELWCRAPRADSRSGLGDLPADLIGTGVAYMVGGLLRALDALKSDATEIGALGDELAELRRKLPRELLEGPDAARIADAAGVRELVADIEGLLVPLLVEESDA